ncbi:MAG: D-alanyl-D-alanine carboxypeptidase, partial [Saprospiraceae bacterium]
MHKYAIIIGVIILSLPACATLRQGRQGRFITRSIERSEPFNRSFSGFYLADAQTGHGLVNIHADKLFTPASNAKILTLAVCLAVLGDSLPRFRYQLGGAPLDVWAITGTGDPTTLHPDFAAWQSPPPMMQDTGKTPVFFFSMPGTAQLPRMPAGWMWDDMPYAFSAEISELPLYGNTIEVTWTGQEWRTHPPIFQSHLKQLPENRNDIRRSALSEEILVPANASLQPDYTQSVPMFNPRQYIRKLLSDTLRGLFLPEPEVYPYYNLAPENRWYACPADTAYRRMMH